MNFDSLRSDLEVVTQQKKPSAGESFADVLRRLDATANESGIPVRLEHYLSKRSYVKALNWLDNPELPHQV